MSKTVTKKQHWRSKVQDSFVPLLGTSGELGISVGGGADYGEFPFVTSAPGGGLTVGDIILEIGGTPVLGMTLGDVRGVLNTCPHPVRIKTVPPGSSFCKDLRLFLSKCFTPGSVDSQLQQVIRENLYLRAVPCTTRQPRVGEISGVDYNFVSVEEFFSLEESGALLESGKFKGNYYGTPHPVHISADSPPITYQEHRNLLRNFRTRSKSLSNLEKTGDDDNSEEDSGLSAGVSSSAPFSHRSPSRRRASSAEDGRITYNYNGLRGSRRGGSYRGMIFDQWDQAFSDPGKSNYNDSIPKRSSWQSPRAPSRETVYRNEWFTDQPSELRGFPVHTHIIKGTRGFGFNIVGGSHAGEFLQVYSVTSNGPSALKTADILVYLNDVCVLGMSHKEVVEMLKSVPVGHTVDVEIRRGYPMLYNPDGCPKQPPPRMMDNGDPIVPPTTVQPQSLNHLPRPPTPQNQHFTFNGIHSEASYMEPLDTNGNAPYYRHSYRRSSMSNAVHSSPPRPPRSVRSLARLQSFDPTLASQSDSEVVSAIGSHRASMIRNHNNNSLSTPPPPLRYGTYKSSESDLSTCTLSRLPMPPSPRRPSSSPGGPRTSHLLRPSPSHSRRPPTPDSPHYTNVNGYHSMPSPSASPSSVSSIGGMSLGSDHDNRSRGELVPVVLGQSEGERGLGFSMMAGGLGGRLAIVKRILDRVQCNSLQPGDAIVKINGADVQSLSVAQIQTVLQEHTKQGEVILLVYRGGIYHSPSSSRRLPPLLLRPPPPPVASENSVFPDCLPLPRRCNSTPPSPAPSRSSLIQSTSFLESIPVTLTMEPKDWQSTGLEDDGATLPDPALEQRPGEAARPFRGFDVELRRKPGEGFGFVIASQDMENGKASLLPHRFVTVRRGSPAAKSGQIRPGDRLEAVEGRSVVHLPHRELSQILRRAGNTLRLTIVPRPSTYSSTYPESNEFDSSHRGRKGQRSRPKRDSRYYSVDLDRGPSGFGFSLRGGSEYNMGLYVLALMEGGPASRSQKMQVSDQLVEINGDSTVGMTHSQAVEQIRRGGHRIHLVLKRGNGYVPDYGRERRTRSLSPLRHPKEQGLAAVGSRRRRAHSSKPQRRIKSSHERDKSQRGRSRRRREADSGLQSPVSVATEREKDRRSRRKKRESQSLPRDALRSRRGSDSDRSRTRAKRRGRSKTRKKRTHSEERLRVEERQTEEQVEEDGEEVLREEVNDIFEREVAEEIAQEEEVEVEEEYIGGEEVEEDVVLPIPSPTSKLPWPKQESWSENEGKETDSVSVEEFRDLSGQYRPLMGMNRELRRIPRPESACESVWSNYEDQETGFQQGQVDKEEDRDREESEEFLKMPLPAVEEDQVSQTELFYFLTSASHQGDNESDSGGSQSDAASISGLSQVTTAAAGHRRVNRTVLRPGPWLQPSEQRVAQVIKEGRRQSFHPGET
ncbi:membrane-associated guanylate kinase, WW and PDZ domain-containing protein 1 isoform X2 [Boleophthalmus pectinirostris]|uniref:membrane-associated guanylate kinase, WW and PDZ domain-containing protein 1 isoform X2 n=1 Tax=Boleophthalmus pectinirostris TaxID=150288 RepID=UPI00242F0A2E|nr:membrane-associated guanylate kinase, WW and PDZ domain-containing protein 1 isoform X2 [Boleophthalmus pectinirostris]